MIKLQKRPTDIILATDFKKIGRNTTVERSALRLLGYTSTQLYDSGLMQKLEAIYNDYKISPSEKNQLYQMLTTWRTNYNMLVNDAERRNISHTSLDNAFGLIETLLTGYLANMDTISDIPNSEFEMYKGQLVWVLNRYIDEFDATAQAINEQISKDAVINEYYGTVSIEVSLSTTSIGVGQSAQATGSIKYKGNTLNQYYLTNHVLFREGSDYYTKVGNVYIKAEVTVGDVIPPNTYYHQSYDPNAFIWYLNNVQFYVGPVCTIGYSDVQASGAIVSLGVQVDADALDSYTAETA